MAIRALLFLLSFVPATTFADLSQDRKICNNFSSWARAFGEARDNNVSLQSALAQLIDVDGMSNDQFARLVKLLSIVYESDQVTSSDIATSVYQGCMRARGHSDA